MVPNLLSYISIEKNYFCSITVPGGREFRGEIQSRRVLFDLTVDGDSSDPPLNRRSGVTWSGGGKGALFCSAIYVEKITEEELVERTRRGDHLESEKGRPR